MVNRGVRQHALDIALHERHRGAHHEGGDSQHVENWLPGRCLGPKSTQQNTKQCKEATRFGHARHEASDWARCALVDIRGPEVEGHRCHLEGKAHQQKDHPCPEQPWLLRDGLRKEPCDLGEVGRARRSIGQRDPVHQHR